jgi:hypothetical protein
MDPWSPGVQVRQTDRQSGCSVDVALRGALTATLHFCFELYAETGDVVSQYSILSTPDFRATGVRSPAEANDFSSSPCVQTGCEVHLASFSMGTGVLSPEVKRFWGVTLTTHPYPVPRSRMSLSYISLPCRLHSVSGTALRTNSSHSCRIPGPGYSNAQKSHSLLTRYH